MKIDVTIDDLNFVVERGTSLMDIDDDCATSLDFMCRGGACGNCAIEIIEGEKYLNSRTSEENILLPILTSKKNIRLACQIVFTGNIVIRNHEIQ